MVARYWVGPGWVLGGFWVGAGWVWVSDGRVLGNAEWVLVGSWVGSGLVLGGFWAGAG